MIEYINEIWFLISSTIPDTVIKISLALLLGLFLGLEREWSNKPAGIRTFSLVCILGSVFIISNIKYLTIVGAIFVVILSILLGLKGIVNSQNEEDINLTDKEKLILTEITNYKYVKDLKSDLSINNIKDIIKKFEENNYILINDDEIELTSYGKFVKEKIDNKFYTGLSLTTSVSLFITYSIGILVALGFYLEAVTIAVMSSFLLLLKNELHKFAWNLSKKELQSAISFGILAFVIFPVLPDDNIGPFNSVNPITVWTLIVAISAVGFINYILIKSYKNKGLFVSSFLGGLVNSTSVVADISSKSSEIAQKSSIGCILLSNSSMSLRNLVLLFIFIPISPTLLMVAFPLIILSLTGVLISYLISDWNADITIENIESPFTMKQALSFGLLFLVVIVLSSVAEIFFGGFGFIGASFISGFISSGTATTTAIALYLNDQITIMTASVGILSGTISSILIKFVYVYASDKKLAIDTFKYSIIMIILSLISLIILYLYNTEIFF